MPEESCQDSHILVETKEVPGEISFADEEESSSAVSIRFLSFPSGRLLNSSEPGGHLMVSYGNRETIAELHSGIPTAIIAFNSEADPATPVFKPATEGWSRYAEFDSQGSPIGDTPPDFENKEDW